MFSVGSRARGLTLGFRSSVAAIGVAGACLGIAGTEPASATGIGGLPPFISDLHIGYAATEAADAGADALQSHKRTRVDSIQNGSFWAQGLNFGTEPRYFASPDNDGAGALGYSSRKRIADNPLAAYAKAPPMAPPVMSPIRYAAWGQFYVDAEWRKGTFAGADIGRDSTTLGGIGGVDAVISGIRSQTDALVVGAFGGTMSSRIRNNDGSRGTVEGPSAGMYAAYVNGGFSIDGMYKVDFLDLDRTAPGVAILVLGMTNHTVAININNKIPMQNGWWVEPTMGFSHSTSLWDGASTALGYQDGTEVRIQGGARAGTTFRHGNVQLEPTFTAMAYSPIIVDGGSVAAAAGTPAAPTDAGKLFGQFAAKLNVIWSRYFSSYVEGEVRGSTDVLGAAGRIGARYNFNPS
jgi:outer membrane autotransporter protein